MSPIWAHGQMIGPISSVHGMDQLGELLFKLEQVLTIHSRSDLSAALSIEHMVIKSFDRLPKLCPRWKPLARVPLGSLKALMEPDKSYPLLKSRFIRI